MYNYDMEGCHRDYPNITHIAADGSVGGTRTGTGGVITHIAEDGSVGGTRTGTGGVITHIAADGSVGGTRLLHA